VTSAVSTEAFTDQQEYSVNGEEDRGGEWFGEKYAQLVLEQETGNSHGHRGDGQNEQQSVVLVDFGIRETPQ
jgi:hypothetical protein